MPDDYIKRSDIEKAVQADMDMQDLYLPIHFLQTVEGIPAADVEPKRKRALTMDETDRERVLYTLEALEKVTEPKGFATVSGTLIREIAEIIRAGI